MGDEMEEEEGEEGGEDDEEEEEEQEDEEGESGFVSRGLCMGSASRAECRCARKDRASSRGNERSVTVRAMRSSRRWTEWKTSWS